MNTDDSYTPHRVIGWPTDLGPPSGRGDTSTATLVIRDPREATGLPSNHAPWSITRLGGDGAEETVRYTLSLSGTFGPGERTSVTIDWDRVARRASDVGDWIAAISFAVSSRTDLAFDPVHRTLTFTSPADGASMAELVVEVPRPTLVQSASIGKR